MLTPNNEEDNQNYLSGSKRTQLIIDCPKQLYKVFEQYCKKEAGGSKSIALYQLLESVRIDEKTQSLLERDMLLQEQIDELKDTINQINQSMKSTSKPESPKFFGSNNKIDKGETNE